MRAGAVCLALLLQGSVLSACGAHPLAAPTRVANATKAALEAAAPVLRDECELPYRDADRACQLGIRAARTVAAVAAASAQCDSVRASIDEACLPATGAYRVARLSHAALVASLAAAEAGGGVEVAQRAAELLQAARGLEAGIRALERKR